MILRCVLHINFVTNTVIAYCLHIHVQGKVGMRRHALVNLLQSRLKFLPVTLY